jgi:twitching motility protein PilJ
VCFVVFAAASVFCGYYAFDVDALKIAYTTALNRDHLALQAAIASGILALLALLLGAAINARNATRLAEEQALERLSSEQRNDATQDAISTLLNEISAVSGGDLTARANVTHNDLTGVIADAFNATTSKLATVVNSIKASAKTVENATKDAVRGVSDVSDAARTQKEEVDGAANRVLNVMETIVQVTSVTSEAARVAGKSKKSAAQGRDAVVNAITSMGVIRDQVEEASARLRRMGEASQEITLITSTVADISEHTGVLALNANVQAAAAGEAGRGFAAVAAEVQRLAMRSEQSLKRVTALVDSLQTDTRGAIATMEKTVAEVEAGVKVVTKAGDDLAIIEMVAGELADLVEQVNTAMSEQGTSASEISDRITRVTDLAAITAGKLAESVEKIRQVSTLTDRLDKSVAEFHV